MAKLPEINVMIDALIKSGLTEVDLNKKVIELQKRKPIYKREAYKRMMYKAICDKEGVDLNIIYGSAGQSPGEFTFTSDVTTDSGQINVRGYVLHIKTPWENTSGTGTRTTFTLVDETGSLRIALNQIEDDLIDRFIAEMGKLPAGIFLTGITCQEFKGNLSVGLPNWETCGWEKIGKGDYGLPDIDDIYKTFATSKTEFEDKEFYLFKGMITDKKQGKGYVGCPKCRRGLKAAAGTHVPCETCNTTVITVEYPNTLVIISDEFDDLSIAFPKFSGITLEDINQLCNIDIQPEVIVNAKFTDKHKLSGTWICPIGDIVIEEGTGKTITVGSIDQLDFSKDVDRKKFERNDKGEVNTADLEQYIAHYIKPISFFGKITPDTLAEYTKNQYKNRTYEMETRPIVEELFNRDLIKIEQDLFAPTDIIKQLRKTAFGAG